MDLTNAVIRASEIATELIRAQVNEMTEATASRTGRRRSTGNLARSVYMHVIVMGENQYNFSLEDPTGYGLFTDFGTRPAATERGPFVADPGKGQGGIIPRFWSTLNDSTIERIRMVFEEELEREVEKELEL